MIIGLFALDYSVKAIASSISSSELAFNLSGDAAWAWTTIPRVVDYAEFEGWWEYILGVQVVSIFNALSMKLELEKSLKNKNKNGHHHNDKYKRPFDALNIGIKEPTQGCQDCKTNQKLIFQWYMKVKKCLY